MLKLDYDKNNLLQEREFRKTTTQLQIWSVSKR